MDQHLHSCTKNLTMSFPNNLPIFPMSPPQSITTDAIKVSLQLPMNNEPLDSHSTSDQPHLDKKAKTLKINHNNTPRTTMVNPPNPAMNEGTNHIFFKTRICARFRLGICKNGKNCNYAHGIEDIRQPPPNWQKLVSLHGNEEWPSRNWVKDHEIIHKMKLCKNFCNGKDCPYGERCIFLHEKPDKFRDDPMMFRESSTISIKTKRSPPWSYEDGHKSSPRVVNTSKPNASNANVRSTYKKTKLCIEWETTGHCPFGEECNFVHGLTELQVLHGRNEAEAARAILASTMAIVPTLPNVPPTFHGSDATPSTTTANGEKQQGKNYSLKLKGKKINGIYGDWPDDFPFV